MFNPDPFEHDENRVVSHLEVAGLYDAAVARVKQAGALRDKYRAESRDVLQYAHELLNRARTIRYTDERQARRLIDEARQLAAAVRARRDEMTIDERALHRAADELFDRAGRLLTGQRRADIDQAAERLINEADAWLADRHELRMCLCRTCRGMFMGTAGRVDCDACEAAADTAGSAQ